MTREAKHIIQAAALTRKTLKEVMTKWDISRSMWINRYGSTDGFVAYFNQQIGLS